MKEYKAYVGIDFGTSGTTFSYWFPKSNSDDKESIKVKKWEGKGTANKTNTEIILDENLDNILAFGKECDTFINQGKKNFLYFSNIKMYLYQNQKEIPDNYSKGKYSIVKVISKILEKIRDEAVNELKCKQKSIQDIGNPDKIIENVRWILTVPAIWTDNSKDLMLQAAQLARLIKKGDDPSYFFALEPEAAACYYSKSDNSEKEILKYPYIICDLGGGTCDITTHERIEDDQGNSTIVELYPPTGGANGLKEINKYIFEELLVKSLFTQEAYETIQNKIKEEDDEDSEALKEDLNNILMYINIFKETFELKKIDEVYRIKIEMFKYGYEDTPDIQEIVKNYNKNARKGWEIKVANKRNWTLEFPYKIINDLLQELIVDKASKYIENIIEYLNNHKKNKREIKTIIFAGGASSNISIIELFRKKNPQLSMVVADDPEVCVAKGAIYFARNPFSISQRIAKYSIGIHIEGKWEEKFEKIKGAQKFYDEEKKKLLCLNRFKTFYRKFESIDVSQGGRKLKCGMNSEFGRLKFYKSDYNGPVYVVGQLDENQNSLTEMFGVLEFTVDNFDEKDTDVEIELNLGGTFITATIVYLKTGQKKHQTFNFM